MAKKGKPKTVISRPVPEVKKVPRTPPLTPAPAPAQLPEHSVAPPPSPGAPSESAPPPTGAFGPATLAPRTTKPPPPVPQPAPEQPRLRFDGALRVAYHELSLEALDRLEVDAICLVVGEAERPLEGLAQLCDWRLCGALSKLLREGAFRGAAGEALLMPGRPRLPAQRLFLFGRGADGGGYATALAALARAKTQAVALEPPPLRDERALAGYLDALSSLGGRRVALFGAPPELKAIVKPTKV